MHCSSIIPISKKYPAEKKKRKIAEADNHRKYGKRLALQGMRPGEDKPVNVI
jgi:hypothetical protein